MSDKNGSAAKPMGKKSVVASRQLTYEDQQYHHFDKIEDFKVEDLDDEGKFTPKITTKHLQKNSA